MIRLAGGGSLKKVYTHDFTHSDTGSYQGITLTHNLNIDILQLVWFVTSPSLGGGLVQVDTYYQNHFATSYGYRWQKADDKNSVTLHVSEGGSRLTPSGPSVIHLFA